MKILVLSDSHSSMGFMRKCVEQVHPDAIIHLGDYYEDGRELSEEYPHIPFHQVPGNCDMYRYFGPAPMKLCYPLDGVMMMMVHGHKQGVKSGISRLVAEARAERAQAVLYGHTHVPDCHQEPDGLWVLNPGSSGLGTAGYMETEDGHILACKILKKSDIEEKL